MINFRKMGNRYLLTDIAGNFNFVSEKELLSSSFKMISKSKTIGIIKNMKDINSSIFKGPGLHIIVLTIRCNHSCLYCQASAKKYNKNYDMDIKTAKKSIDFAFKTLRDDGLSIEFQGGEPLMNWEVLKESIIYARKKESETKKPIELGVVTNLSLMDKEKADFLIENDVYICSSLDGNEYIHNNNRIFCKGNSYKRTIKWLKYFSSRAGWRTKNGIRKFYPRPNALLTVTKKSLKYPKEIVSEYVRLNLRYIFTRPFMPFGYANNPNILKKISYSGEEFIDFYKKILNEVIDYNKKGIDIKERTARIFLTKILRKKDSHYLDIRNPCGASIGQLAYNYNGDIFTCDEGRMLWAMGDGFFKVGNIFESKYEDVIKSDKTKLCLSSSILDSQVKCFRCVYKPYCGVCPVYNYVTQNSVNGNMVDNLRCTIYTGVLDYLFELIQDKEVLKIFKRWVRYDFR